MRRFIKFRLFGWLPWVIEEFSVPFLLLGWLGIFMPLAAELQIRMLGMTTIPEREIVMGLVMINSLLLIIGTIRLSGMIVKFPNATLLIDGNLNMIAALPTGTVIWKDDPRVLASIWPHLEFGDTEREEIIIPFEILWNPRRVLTATISFRYLGLPEMVLNRYR
ncbi:hypothetical protein HY523_01980 [Candidatus Berkelbacteria bacterium]|nr:hypothetical protein [Candidatus Berkelbacteria bacterium]